MTGGSELLRSTRKDQSLNRSAGLLQFRHDFSCGGVHDDDLSVSGSEGYAVARGSVGKSSDGLRRSRSFEDGVFCSHIDDPQSFDFRYRREATAILRKSQSCDLAFGFGQDDSARRGILPVFWLRGRDPDFSARRAAREHLSIVAEGKRPNFTAVLDWQNLGHVPDMIAHGGVKHRAEDAVLRMLARRRRENCHSPSRFVGLKVGVRLRTRILCRFGTSAWLLCSQAAVDGRQKQGGRHRWQQERRVAREGDVTGFRAETRFRKRWRLHAPSG